jgi:hypothetical protein
MGVSFAAPKDMTYSGEVMDSHCAAMGNHGGKDPKACTNVCVKGGASYVLYNSAQKAIYQLDDQKKPVDSRDRGSWSPEPSTRQPRQFT